MNSTIKKLMDCDRLFDSEGKQNGIIDELIRQMTKEKEVISKSKQKDSVAHSWTLNIIKNNDFVLGSFALYVYNQIYKYFSGADDRNDRENLLGNALLITSETLIELVTLDKYKIFFDNLNLEQNVDGMKAILINEDYSKILYNYLKKIVEIKIKLLIREGCSYNVDGSTFNKNGEYIFTDFLNESDMNNNEDEDFDGYINNIMDKDSHNFTEYSNKDYDSVLEFVIDNKEDIFTNKQLEFMKEWGNKEKYTKQDSYKYRKNIKKRLFDYCDNNDKIAKNDDGKYKIKKTKLDVIILETINQEIGIDKFNYFMTELSKDEKIFDFVMDKIIENFDNSYYRPIVNYINNKKIDLVFINTKFSEILFMLTKHN